MLIKQFRSQYVRVADPLRPGRRTLEERLIPTGASGLSVNGAFFESGPNGWIDAPDPIAADQKQFRTADGRQWYEPHEVDERASVEDATVPMPDRAKPKARAAD